MNRETTTSIGNWGEKLAAGFLENLGFLILEKNWRWNKAEIDLIGKHGNTLVFIEVKTRKNNRFGHPEEFVSRTKANRIKEASVQYQFEKNFEGFIRFDIVAITGTAKQFEILHLADAF